MRRDLKRHPDFPLPTFLTWPLGILSKLSSKHQIKGLPGLQLAAEGSGKMFGVHKREISLKPWSPEEERGCC